MDWAYLFFAAIGLVLVIEGIYPFVSPRKYKEWLLKLSFHSNRFLRQMGLVLMLIGAGLIVFAHWYF